MKHRNSLILLSTLVIIATQACQKPAEETAKSNTNSTISSSNATEVPAEPKTEKRAEVDRGAKLYKRCATCHTLEKDGRHKVGPNLYGIFGANIAAKEGFSRYSKASKASDIIWTDENLRDYIKNPREFLPGTGMTFAGIRNEGDVDLLLEHMRKKMSD